MMQEDERRRLEEEETQLLRRALGDDAARQAEDGFERRAVLEVYDLNGDLLSIVTVPPSGLSIGRAADQDVRLSDQTVSRRHARIEFVNGGWFIDDAGSLNDTLLNGELVHGRAELHDGAQLTIGLHSLRLTIR